MTASATNISTIASDIASRCVHLGDEKNRVNYLTFTQKLSEACASYSHVNLLLLDRLPADIYSCLASVSLSKESKINNDDLEKLGYLHELQRFQATWVAL